MMRLVHTGWMGCVLAAGLVACGGGGGDPSAGVTDDNSLGNLPRIEAYESARVRAKMESPGAAFATAARVASVRLEALPSRAATDAKAVGKPGALRQIGMARPITAAATSAATAQLLTWQGTASGGTAAAVNFRSEGASALRLGLMVTRLPAQATVRVSAAGGGDVAVFSGQQVLDTLARNLAAGDRSQAGRTFWLPAVGGPEARLDIVLPPGVDPAQVEVAVPQLSHLWVDLARGEDAFLKIGESDSCHLDANCFPEYQDESRAVARMEFINGGQTFLCTGTLMADVAATGTPWFLSARHCISDQATASTLTTYWFYRSSSCNSADLNLTNVRLVGGATLLFASANTDTAFMRLDRDPPAGVLFAGSLLAAPAAGVQVTGLHHPLGDLLKFSRGLLTRYADCATQEGQLGCGVPGDNFATVQWSSGTTQAGSSGSALFTRIEGGEFVMGHLFAGLASCLRRGEPDYYGRFDIPYRAALHQYLGDVPGAR